MKAVTGETESDDENDRIYCRGTFLIAWVGAVGAWFYIVYRRSIPLPSNQPVALICRDIVFPDGILRVFT
jgi:hypothetical protein